MRGILKLTIELTEQGARRMHDMRMRLNGGKKFSDLVRNALGMYEALDQEMLPGDTLWIKRGNQLIEVTELNLPARPVSSSTSAGQTSRPNEGKLPPGWRVITEDENK